MYKTADELEAALALPYSGPTKEKDGFTYIPATESRRALDRLAGPLGWEESDPVLAIDPAHGIYTAAVRITLHVLDENGTTRDVSRVGFGRSTAQASKREREEQGLSVTASLQIHDTAAAAAGTDAFSRACKMFGPALGSDLYDGERTQTSSTTSRPSSGYSSTSRPKGPSDAQRGVLNRLGYDDAAIEAMPFATWKGYVDEYFKNRTKKSSAPDDLPF